jgi:hypothetical protein
MEVPTKLVSVVFVHVGPVVLVHERLLLVGIFCLQTCIVLNNFIKLSFFVFIVFWFFPPPSVELLKWSPYSFSSNSTVPLSPATIDNATRSIVIQRCTLYQHCKLRKQMMSTNSVTNNNYFTACWLH